MSSVSIRSHWTVDDAPLSETHQTAGTAKSPWSYREHTVYIQKLVHGSRKACGKPYTREPRATILKPHKCEKVSFRFEWLWASLRDLAKYSMTRSTRGLSAIAELLDSISRDRLSWLVRVSHCSTAETSTETSNASQHRDDDNDDTWRRASGHPGGTGPAAFGPIVCSNVRVITHETEKDRKANQERQLTVQLASRGAPKWMTRLHYSTLWFGCRRQFSSARHNWA